MTTIQVPLTQGYEATIDAEDWDKVKDHKWSLQRVKRKHGELFYAKTAKKKNTIMAGTQMHRFIVCCPEGMIIDHIDGNGLNNTRKNLRIVMPGENVRNSKRGPAATGFIGVYKHKDRFRVQVVVDKKNYSCGLYDTAWEAAIARDRYAKELHGSIVRFNFPGIVGVLGDPQ